jgi:hypothetical protein
MQHATDRGRLVYTSTRPEMAGRVRGGETFVVTRAVDGSRTLRCHCQIDENSPRVLRDSFTTLDRDWMPTGGFVSVTVDERFVGSCWYHFTPTLAECEGYTVQEGRISRRFELERPIRVFGTHPLFADGYMVQAYDLSEGAGRQQVNDVFMCAGHNRGADGPTLLNRGKGSSIAYFGPETVNVPAGTFEALHFQIGESNDDVYMGRDIHPPYHIWVTADGHYTFVRATITGHYASIYELVEFETTPGASEISP